MLLGLLRGGKPSISSTPWEGLLQVDCNAPDPVGLSTMRHSRLADPHQGFFANGFDLQRFTWDAPSPQLTLVGGERFTSMWSLPTNPLLFSFGSLPYGLPILVFSFLVMWACWNHTLLPISGWRFVVCLIGFVRRTVGRTPHNHFYFPTL